MRSPPDRPAARNCDLFVATTMLRIFVRKAQAQRGTAFTANAVTCCKAIAVTSEVAAQYVALMI
jgi:hypothetical protein